MELENIITENEVIENETAEETLPDDTQNSETDISDFETDSEEALPPNDMETGTDSNESPEVSENVDENTEEESNEFFDTVSGSDDYDAIWNNGFPSVSDNNSEYLTTLSFPEEVPFWEKPFKDYTTSEALLFLIFVLLVVAFIYNLLKG